MVEDRYIWIDAGDFSDYGGWQLDTQFVHLMGSGYLLANGVSEPVDDATVTVDIPQAGNYRLWVRAKNWYAEYAPGRFRVSVNGATSDHVFGEADTEDWVFESGGEFQLEAGELEIALHDLTGYFGRCNAVILTTDSGYVPPEGVEEVCEERARLTELSLEERDGGKFDVIVIGAGSGGFPAAVAAARFGANTALIHDRPVLGGNASKELGVHISGAASGHWNARESGIIEELGRIKARYDYPSMTGPFRQIAEDEPNLSVFRNQRVIDVKMSSDERIEAVVAKDSLENTMTVYRGDIFIDGTGDGWVGYFADAEFRFGRERRAEFDEEHAPEASDEITMSGCLMGGCGIGYRAADTGQAVEYTPPPWAADLPPAEEFGRRLRRVNTGEWWLEHEGTIDDLWDAEKARDELIRISYGYWDFLKNEWEQRERAGTYRLSEIFIGDAKRETRRLMGDYILTENDVWDARMFDDRISYGGWSLDVHHPEGIYSGDDGPFDCNPPVPMYSIPYRCLYSRNIDNLMMAGRHVSVTHIALGTVRVQGTLATLGQAAGTAAAMAIDNDTTPRGIYEDHIAELQQILLKHDQYIPGIRNEDSEDVGRQAKVVASSTAEYDRLTKKDVNAEQKHELTTERAMMFPAPEDEPLRKVSLLLHSEADEPVELTLHLREAAETGDMSSCDDIATATVTVPAGETRWVEFEVNAEVEAQYAWVWLPKAENVYWLLMTSAPMGCCRAWGLEGEWTVKSGEYYAIDTDPVVQAKTDYRPENVINGVSRMVDDNCNMWASDGTEPMPQWIELQFDRPRRINSVYLTFDTNQDQRFYETPIVPQCVRDYRVSYFDGDRWQTIIAEQGNFQRQRKHQFTTIETDRVRLTVDATNGTDMARVFEIRAYNE